MRFVIKKIPTSIYKVLFTIFIMSASSSNGYGQVIGIPVSDPTYAIIERLMMKTNGGERIHSSHRYYTRADVLDLLQNLDTSAFKNPKDLADIQFLVDECRESDALSFPVKNPELGEPIVYLDSTRTFYTTNSEAIDMQYIRPRHNAKPLFGFLYKTPPNFLEVDVPLFYARVNPVIDFNYGRSNSDIYRTTFSNIRGAELRGGIADRVFFYANVHETQEAYPEYVNQWVSKYNSVPGAGFRKDYIPTFLKGVRGYDFLNAQGVVGFNLIPQISVQFGHGRNFIGDGQRSMFLSDFGTNYLYLKLNTKVWVFDYQNIFAELNATSQRRGDDLIPKKYFASHHLSLNIKPWLNVGLFESIVFSRNEHFELQYLNPIIFYRTVEQLVGSPDNAMVGANFKIKMSRSVKLYGQLLLDELKIKNILKQNGWWGNKYGIQLGGAWYDFAGINHLDLHAEYNLIRPYTFTHGDSSANYTHYQQPLAHPLGANFSEFLFKLRWLPIQKLTVEQRLMFATIGEDIDGVSYGSNPLLPYTNRTGNFGIELAQGEKVNISSMMLDVSYMLYHNIHLDASIQHRRSNSINNANDRVENIFSLGLRMNIGKRDRMF